MTELASRIQTSTGWLVALQRANGGWGEQRGRYTNSINTAEAIISLLDTDADHLGPGSRPIQRGVDYLLGQQCAEGEHRGCWFRNVVSDGPAESAPVPDVGRTAIVVEALFRTGRGADDPAVAAALAWLVRVRNDDGGWSYGERGASILFPTCRVVSALLGAVCSGWEDGDGVLGKGLGFVLASRRADGSFGGADRLQAANTLEVVLLLQKARRQETAVPENLERRAIDWMLEHPDHVLRPVEEEVVLDPAQDAASYEFVHALDLMTLRVLASSTNDGDRLTQLYRDAQIKVKDRLDDDGGVFGFRTFSWSTAQALSGLVEARSQGMTAFPRREPEAPAAAGAAGGGDTLLLRVALALALVVFPGALLIAAFAVGGLGLGLAFAVLTIAILGAFLVLAGLLTGESWAQIAKTALGQLSGGGG